ncbi:hypothetical protein BDZ89DRAFT_759108 [Hymenopellis radicata]|nr:hypothetical protein BDZ89DRAFT_759108 [Hymenopellis radicata]
MASYLPVLLVSLSTNSNDDSAVTTLPRGQVDYLSHEWQEEDVWRSWRNMTRQKNEIANGMRLENASWRTWWKQRNKLKTISPETLNWLKDSDVTWLYGPLHTAVEWTPPPRKSTVTPNDHLDLSQPKHKPILKHRNLSEFLTSDLPQSPVFSPPESDSEHSQDEDEDKDDDEAEAARSGPRPLLPHTKSDTHLTRLSKPNRAFRKESPPRVEPPNSGLKSSHAYSGTNLNGYFQSHINHAPASKTPSPSGTDSATPTHSGIAGHSKKKSKHITFNTFVEQCIAIDKPKSRSSSKVRSGWDGRTGTKGVNWDVNYQDADEDEIEEVGDERGYDEDVESSDEGDWKRTTDADNEFAICTDSEDSDADIPSSYPPSNDSDEEDDGIIQMRPPRRPSASAPRSHSKSSTSSNSTSSSASSSGSRKRTYTASSRRRNSSSASTLRPVLP